MCCSRYKLSCKKLNEDLCPNWTFVSHNTCLTFNLPMKESKRPEQEFLSLWWLGTEEEEGYRTGPPGYIGWRISFLGIDSGAPNTFKNTGSVCRSSQTDLTVTVIPLCGSQFSSPVSFMWCYEHLWIAHNTDLKVAERPKSVTSWPVRRTVPLVWWQRPVVLPYSSNLRRRISWKKIRSLYQWLF